MHPSKQEVVLVIRGLISLLPSQIKPVWLKRYLRGHPSGHPALHENDARYCYSVWMRHLAMLHSVGAWNWPAVVAEIGPGKSLGVGLAALLTGAEVYIALDVTKRTDIVSNLSVFDELVELFRSRAPIPDEKEFPRVTPLLQSYDFPHSVLDDKRLDQYLTPARLKAIRSAISLGAKSPDREPFQIRYVVPWDDLSVVESSSVDLLISQAVLEHVTDPDHSYDACYSWLRAGGIMTHCIDFKCHDVSSEWNGHWTYPDKIWRLIFGRRPYLINRLPCGEHIRLLKARRFKILLLKRYKRTSRLTRRQLAQPFRNLSDEDLQTSGIHVVARK